MQITWYGQSFFEIESATGTTVLLDPWMDGNPMNDVTPDDFDPDVIAITHGHADHTTDAHRFEGVPIIGQPETTGYLAKQGHQENVGMNVSGTYEYEGVSFTMTKAFHSSGAPLEADYDYYTGTPVGYIIDDGETVLYDAGDTGLFGDMKTVIRDIYAPDIALIPIGDRHTMGPETAGIAADWLDVDAAIPQHYDTFPFLEQDPDEFASAASDADVFIPDIGETIEY
jgi:L-ascorbate metabolism protein UlaG (beta-lactamase superfamily)